LPRDKTRRFFKKILNKSVVLISILFTIKSCLLIDIIFTQENLKNNKIEWSIK